MKKVDKRISVIIQELRLAQVDSEEIVVFISSVMLFISSVMLFIVSVMLLQLTKFFSRL